MQKMTHHSIEVKDQIFVKAYGFCLLSKILAKILVNI